MEHLQASFRKTLKGFVAFSSVSHMGFVMLGISSLTPTSLNGQLCRCLTMDA